MRVLIWCLAGLLVLYLLAAYLVFVFMCRRTSILRSAMRRLTHSVDGSLEPYRKQIDEGQTFLRETPHEDVSVTSFDGLRLAASYYRHPAPRGVMIACHGYRSTAVRDFSCIFRFTMSWASPSC